MAQQVRLGASVSTKREDRHTEICAQWPEQPMSDPGQNRGVHSSSSKIVRENDSATEKVQVLTSVTPATVLSQGARLALLQDSTYLPQREGKGRLRTNLCQGPQAWERPAGQGGRI